MNAKKLTSHISVSTQLAKIDVTAAKTSGFSSIINNRPDGEEKNQPTSDELRSAAEELGLTYRHMPITPGGATNEDALAFETALSEMPRPILAFCRTGTRSATLWALSEAAKIDVSSILKMAAAAGHDLTKLEPRLRSARQQSIEEVDTNSATQHCNNSAYDVIIVGGGAGGIATASSLLKRAPELDIVVIEPADKHYYQPGWTMVGGGVFDKAQTQRSMKSVMPSAVKWVKTAVAAFEPDRNEVVLEDGQRLKYRILIAAPGLKLDWDGIDGLRESIGKNGVTSNYMYDMAPYTWELIQGLREGRALFSQPNMPIKCAGAPQKAMYLACDHWRRTRALRNIDVEFRNAVGVLFGVPDYVPALMRYIDKYGINLKFNENLVRVDGAARHAWFERTDEEGNTETVRTNFDMLHVCPPQTALDFVRSSPLANDAGWIDVNQETLQHSSYDNVFALGDACSTPNAKTAAAVRKQAPIVAENVIAALLGRPPCTVYDGYGSCPLTVERGKIVLAEFGYGGKLLPTFPTWMNNGTKPTRRAWYLKEKVLPNVYFNYMLKGREILAAPNVSASKLDSK